LAKATVTSAYLLQGAVYALEQCGLLLRDANALFHDGSYASAIVLAAFAREELGRSNILFDLRSAVLSGETVTAELLAQRCGDH
jgi:AbiV family abortive infection protein